LPEVETAFNSIVDHRKRNLLVYNFWAALIFQFYSRSSLYLYIFLSRTVVLPFNSIVDHPLRILHQIPELVDRLSIL